MVLSNAADHSAFRRDYQAAQEHAEAAVTLAANQGLGFRVPHATIMHGWAIAKQGRRVEGLAQLRQGLANLEEGTGARRFIHFLALLAEVCSDMGQVEQGVTVLAEALSLTDQSGSYYYAAELHCLKGELILKQTEVEAHHAEISFQQALEIARRQEARSLELRAATSLARLCQSQGKHQNAHDLLAPVSGWFTEGFDTADLREAKTLLQELA